MAVTPREPGQVVRGSAWFMVSIAIMAVGGFVAWAVAARVQPVGVVGGATALFASVLFLTYLTGMGLPVAVARYGHGSAPTTEGLWSWALVYAAVASVIGAAAFVVVAPAILGPGVTDPLTQLGPLGATALLASLVIGTAWATLAEVRLMTLRAWPWIVLRATVTVTVRIPLIFTPVAAEPLGLFIVMAAPAAISGYVSVGLLAVRREARRLVRLLPVPNGLRKAWHFASVNWVGSLAAQAPQFAAPLIVAAVVTPDENAEFYLAWSIATVVFLVPHTIGQVVVSEASRVTGRLRHHVRLGLIVGLAVGVVATLGAVVGRSLVTTVFGDGYVATANVLPLLCAAALPWTVTSMCLAVVRTREEWVGTMVITAGFAILTLVPIALLVPSRGITGAGTAWVIGNVAAAVVASVTMLGAQLSTLRRHHLSGNRGQSRHQATSASKSAPSTPTSTAAP